MRQTLPDLLWLGHAGDVADLRKILDAGITALVDLALNEPIPQLTREVIYCRFPLVDGVGNSGSLLRAATQTVAMLLDMRTPTLVYCSNGMSRSPAIAAAALAMFTGKTAASCLELIAELGPHDVSAGLWQDLLGACFPPIS
jgi:protein-tyrosine phosphatase